MNNKKFFLLFLLLFLSNIVFVSANNHEKRIELVVTGNKKISTETIKSLINYNNIMNFNVNELNNIQKKLFESNFFSKISIKKNNNNIEITLVENPLIEFIIIEGLEDQKFILDKIDKSLSLKTNEIFSDINLKKDLNLIKNIVSSYGYYSAITDYQINKVDNDNVNIFIKVNLNKSYKVKNISFIGDKKFSSSRLLSEISTTEDWLLNFSKSSIPSYDRLNYDVSLLKNFYLSRGYYDVQITSSSINISDDGNADIVFSINAGEKYFINNFLIDNKSISVSENDLKFVKNNFLLLKNKIYNPSVVRKSLDYFNKFLEKNEFSANASFLIKKVSSNKLDLLFRLNELSSNEYVSNIIVNGNEITEERVIRNNLLFGEGDVINEYKLENSKDLLNSLNIFENVKISKQKIANSNNTDILVEVSEKATGEISAGAGYGTAGAGVTFGIRESNFLGKGIVGIGNLQLSTEKVIGSISFSDPDFLGTGNTFRNSFFASEYSFNDSGYSNRIIGDSISLRYEFLENTFFEPGISLDLDKIDASSSSIAIIKSRDGNYFSSKAFYTLFKDSRDKKYKTTSGYTAGVKQEFSSFFSDIPYVSNSFFGSYYSEFSEKFIGTIKYRVQSINSFDGSPVKLSDRFFISSDMLRGFGQRQIGPKIDNIYVGGNYSYSSSFSTSFPTGIPDSWNIGTSLFLDVGNVWGSDFDGLTSNENQIRSSVGVGLSWTSPIGPLSFSLAEPISKASGDTIEKFSFRIGTVF